MEHVIQHLFFRQQNEPHIAHQLLKELGVFVDRQSLAAALEEHPDFPSLLAIKDVLSKYGVDSMAVRLENEHYAQITIPFISQTRYDSATGRQFTLVRPKGSNLFEYLSPHSGKWETILRSETTSVLEPIALFTEIDEQNEKLRKDQRQVGAKRIAALQWLKLLIVPICGLIIWAWFQMGPLGAEPLFSLYFFLFLLGTGSSILLLLFEIDQHNPIVKQVCSGSSKKIDCGAVLNSSGAQFLGLSWSLIGFTYFLGGLIILAIADISTSAYLATLATISLLAVPYVLYSIYYQWRVVKQWCRLCLAVQGVLVSQAIIVIASGWHTSIWNIGVFPMREVLSMLFVYALVFVIGDALIHSGQKSREGKKNKQALIRLKSNTDIFSSLLKNQRNAPELSNDLGIVLGNPDAKNTLVKVCNPYCGPCATAHPNLSALLSQNKDLKVQIVFTATNDDNDRKGPPVRHLLAIAQQGQMKKTKKSLDDWYLAKEKNYENFAELYPMNGELDSQKEHVDRMRKWCDEAQIQHTPTYFLNGYEVPQIYGLSDLDYFLKS